MTGLRVWTRVYWVLPSLARFTAVYLGCLAFLLGFESSLSRYPEFDWVSLDLTWVFPCFYMFSLGCVQFYWVLIGFCLVLPDFTVFYLVLPSF